MRRLSASDQLAAEISAVAGGACGRSCEHHVHSVEVEQDGPPVEHRLVCLRAPGHQTSTSGVMVDRHAGRMPDGSLVVFGEECCGTDDAG